MNRPRNKCGRYIGHYDRWITKFTGHSGIYAGHCHSLASFPPSSFAWLVTLETIVYFNCICIQSRSMAFIEAVVVIISNREFKLRVIRQTANARQRKNLRYQAIKSKWTCCFKTEIHSYSFDASKKIWNENVQRQFCQESSNLPFAVPGNVKLKLPNNINIVY
jgi:hypothetical protein